MGTYDSLKSCENAIVAIYTTRLIVPNLQYSQQQITVINNIVTTQLQYQQDYRCVAK